MSTLSISFGTHQRQAGRTSVSRSLSCTGKGFLAVDLLKSSFKGSGVWLNGLERPNGRSVHKLRVSAKIRKGLRNINPWYKDIDPNLKSGHLTFLSDFKPLAEKPKPVVLEFEKPLIDFEKKIDDVRKMATETGLDFSDQISSLERKYQQALKELYTHLSPYQRLSIARHPNRPTFLDHVLNITEKWIELHGDRAGYDDPAIVSGLGSMDGRTYMFIGQQKGRDTKENIKRNFAMPTPHGYRKAKRMMEYADHHGFPIITFVDTAGAYADMKSEELGQGEAIANNLRTMFGLKVPIVTVVIGEGGSGGALAIACANKLLMLENAVFFVASPEAAAAILWKSSKEAPKAAARMRITAREHYKFKIADAIIPEPMGGAHNDPAWTSQQIKLAIKRAMDELTAMNTEELLQQRHLKFRSIGKVGSKDQFLAYRKKKLQMRKAARKRRMQASDAGAPLSTSPVSTGVGIKNMKKTIQQEKGPSLPSAKGAAKPSTSPVSTGKAPQVKGPSLSPAKGTKETRPVMTDMTDENKKKLSEKVDQEMANALISMGLKEKFDSLKLEFSNATANPGQPLDPELKKKADVLRQEFEKKLSQSEAYLPLKQKLEALMSMNTMGQKERHEKLKKEINEKIQNSIKQKMEILKTARERVAKGEQLDEAEKAEIKLAKEELVKALEFAKLNVVGVRKKVAPKPQDLVEKIGKINETIGKEIEQAVDSAGLSAKIVELKEEVKRGSSRERITKLEAEIKEGIVAVMDLPALKQEVEGGLTPEVSTMPEASTTPEASTPLEAVGVDGNVSVDNGRA